MPKSKVACNACAELPDWVYELTDTSFYSCHLFRVLPGVFAACSCNLGKKCTTTHQDLVDKWSQSVRKTCHSHGSPRGPDLGLLFSAGASFMVCHEEFIHCLWTSTCPPFSQKGVRTKMYSWVDVFVDELQRMDLKTWSCCPTARSSYHQCVPNLSSSATIFRQQQMFFAPQGYCSFQISHFFWSQRPKWDSKETSARNCKHQNSQTKKSLWHHNEIFGFHVPGAQTTHHPREPTVVGKVLLLRLQRPAWGRQTDPLFQLSQHVSWIWNDRVWAAWYRCLRRRRYPSERPKNSVSLPLGFRPLWLILR